MYRIMENYTIMRIVYNLHITKWMNLTTKCCIKEIKHKRIHTKYKVLKEVIVIYCDRGYNVIYYLCGVWSIIFVGNQGEVW